jgi:hypothetical protein
MTGALQEYGAIGTVRLVHILQIAICRGQGKPEVSLFWSHSAISDLRTLILMCSLLVVFQLSDLNAPS